MVSSIDLTATCVSPLGLPRKPTRRSLVQLHPLALDQGPIDLKQDSVTIGRSSECDLQITDQSISRRHAEIRSTVSESVIVDLGSTNGVLVNEVPVPQAALRTGDRIQLGTLVFRYLADDDLESQYHDTVYSMMTRDGLTGVYNRRYLTETLDREVARCKRRERPIALLMAGVQDFAAINQLKGFVAGDQVLREVAKRLECVLRKDDVVARFGGEKFAIMVVESEPRETLEIARRCRDSVAGSAIETAVGPVDVRLSVGVAAPQRASVATSEALIQDADARLAEAGRSEA